MINIDKNIDFYLDDCDGYRDPNARSSSFDYCYNYFQCFRDRKRFSDLAAPAWIEQSCLQLGFYLASWGMFRGGTELSNRSLCYYEPILKAVAGVNEDFWSIDVAGYNDDTISAVLEVGREIRKTFPGFPGYYPSDTLLTKIMLGVFGCVPALDTNFINGWRAVRRDKGWSGLKFDKESLANLHQYHKENADTIDKHQIMTLDFHTGEPTHRKYPQAKKLDMIFFTEGDPRFIA